MNSAFTLNGKDYSCYFELTIDLIGGKWKPIILFYLGSHDILRFSELKRHIPKITERMLTRQLRELEAAGLVHREVYHQVPPKVEYSLTPLGKSMMSIIYDLRDWGESYYHSFDEKHR